MELIMDLKRFIKETIDDHRKRVFAAIRDLTLDEMYWKPKRDTNPIGFSVSVDILVLVGPSY